MSKSRRRKNDGKHPRKTRPSRTSPWKAARTPSGAATRTAARPTGAAQAAGRPPSRVIAPWWERYPGRLEWELHQLEAAGLPARIDEAARASGQIILDVDATLHGEQHTLRVVFPDFYPELRFEVFAPTLDLGRHQNPFEKNLCLLDRSTRAWSTQDSVATFLVERVPKVLELLDDEQAMKEAEIPQGEPFTAYYAYQDGGIVFVPEVALRLPSTATQGFLQFRLEPKPSDEPLRGLLFEVSDGESRRLSQAEPQLADIFSNNAIQGRWVRLSAPPRAADGPGVDALLREEHPEMARMRWRPLGGRRLDVVGLVFPEEVAQGEYEDTWLFLIRQQHGETYLCRSQRVSESDFLARIPELAGLRQCSVGIVGLGGIGAPSALEFARCQVGELRLLEYDFVEAGTLVRWPFGMSVAGYPKLHVVYNAIKRNHPYTRLQAFPGRIGMASRRRPDARPQHEVLSEFLDGLDLIYDATAEWGVQHLLSILASEWGIPQVYVSGTEGGWGGVVARCIPGQAGCWFCWKKHIEEGTIPAPPAQPNGLIQPRGCGTRTFTGAGFDLAPVVSQGVRVAVQTVLSSGSSRSDGTSYPPSDFDVSVLYLRERKGTTSGCPRWEHYQLPVHSECPHCRPA